MKTVTFPVRGMNFATCANGIEKHLQALQAVAAVDASYVTQTVTITFDERNVSENTLRDYVSDCGYACDMPLTYSATPRQQAAPALVDTEQTASSDMTHDSTPSTLPMAPMPDHATMAHETAPPAPPAPLARVQQAAAGRPEMAHGEMAHGEMAHGGMAHDMSDPAMAAAMEADMRRRFWVALVLTIPIVLYSPLALSLFHMRLATPFGVSPNWVMLVLATPVVWWCGWVFHSGAWRALSNRSLDMNVLVSLGVLVAYLFSVFATLVAPSVETSFDAAAMLVTFVLFGHWMEMRSRRGSSDALNALLRLAPAQANVIGADGQPRTVPVEDVQVGDLLLLRPGDKVPVDATVIEGASAIDESLVTGESLPVAKQMGDEVIGGTVNGSGSLRLRATRVGAETALAQIVELVRTAQNSKAPAQRLADRAAQYLVIGAVSAGVLTFLIWFFLIHQTALFALTLAVTAVVIACPDALGLATPTAVAVGTGLGARNGILIKNATALEQVSRIQAIIFDKTGTLTEGKPAVTDILPLYMGDGAASDLGDETHLLRIAAAAETDSEHPLARTIVEEAARRGMEPLPSRDFAAIAGGGVQATVEGRNVLIGTPRLLAEHSMPLADADQSRMADLQAQGKTVMAVAVDGRPAGLIAAADQIRPSASHTIAALQGLDVQVALLTGDNRRTGEAAGKVLGIPADRIFAEVLPADKARYVAQLQKEGLFTAMVGDGVNDAPALAQADLGIAIGAGSGVAIETAQVVLMRSDPLDVLAAIRLSRATVRKMKQNLFWAAIYNVIAIPIAAGVLYPFGILLNPAVAALAMSASSITVATNAVLLKRVEPELRSIRDSKGAEIAEQQSKRVLE